MTIVFRLIMTAMLITLTFLITKDHYMNKQSDLKRIDTSSDNYIVGFSQGLMVGQGLVRGARNV